MKKSMKLIAVISLLMIIFISLSTAENKSQTDKKSESAAKSEISNAEYTSAVAAILKNYNAATLTNSDARAINNAFRQAGVRQGDMQQAAIKAAGFDPHKISSLDPPPEKNAGPEMNQKNRDVGR